MKPKPVSNPARPERRAVGRPTSFRPEYVEMGYRLACIGLTDEEMAIAFGVAESSFRRWWSAHSEFRDSIKAGKTIADGRVAESLFKRATGYSHPDTYFSSYEGVVTATPTEKHYPPDATSMIFWLKNRQPKLWRDRFEARIESTVAGVPEDVWKEIQARAAEKARTNGHTPNAETQSEDRRRN